MEMENQVATLAGAREAQQLEHHADNTASKAAPSPPSPSRSVRSLFASFDSVADSLVSAFISSVPESFSEAASRLLGQRPAPASDFVLQNRARLVPHIANFHRQAGSLGAEVQDAASLLSDPLAQVVVSTHQPNLFAYAGIFKKIVLLETLKRSVEKADPGRRIVNLFLVVDHDFVEETWVRLAQLPSMSHSSGIMELRLPSAATSGPKRWQMVCNVPLPSQTVLASWKRQVKFWIRRNSRSGDERRACLSNLDQLWSELEAAHARARSYADLNSFLMSRIVNGAWGYSTLFVRLSEIPAVFENGFTFLISNFGIYSDALRKAERLFMSRGIDTGVSSSAYLNAPVWLHCGCGSKAAVKIATAEEGGGNNGDGPRQGKKQRQKLLLSGQCMSCKKELGAELGDADSPDLSGVVQRLSPRAIPIPLLLTRDLGISCYASGTGGIGYLVDASIAGKKLGTGLPMVAIWPARDAYCGIGQLAAVARIREDSYEVGAAEEEVVGVEGGVDGSSSSGGGNSNNENNNDSSNDNDKVGTYSYVIEARLDALARRHAHYEKTIRPMLAERGRRIRAGEDVSDLLAQIFALKQEQRAVRRRLKSAERVRNALRLSPCFVDYAVNFGTRSAAERWQSHLLRESGAGEGSCVRGSVESLASPVLFFPSPRPRLE